MIKTRLMPLSALTLALSAALTVNAAEYRVVEIGTQDKSNRNFAAGITESGQVIVHVQDEFLTPDVIDIDLAAKSSNLEQYVDDGEVSKEDLVELHRRMTSSSSFRAPTLQKIGKITTFLSTNSDIEQIPGFDQISADTEVLTQSVNTLVSDVNATGVSVGTANPPYSKVDFTNSEGTDLTYLVRDFHVRGFATIDGKTVELPPDDATAGGYSDARAISNTGYVAGGTSTDPSDTLIDIVSVCADEEERADLPEALCINNIAATGFNDRAINNSGTDIGWYSNNTGQPVFKNRAMVWKLDGEGNISSQQVYGILYEPDADDSNNYLSKAFDVNDSGIAVGHADHHYQDRRLRTRTGSEIDAVARVAAVFREGKVELITDEEDYTDQTLFNRRAGISRATGINNNNQVIGYAIKTVNGVDRNKFFVYDLDSQTVTFPNDFFPGSASRAHDINDAGVVVGEGEVETTSENNRRKSAFIFEIGKDEKVRDLNTLIGCDSPYTLVQADGINEKGEIAATAIVSRARRDINGDVVTNDDGSEVVEDTIVAVKLEPIPGGQIDDCQLIQEPVERKGASLNWIALASLFGIGLFRRRQHK